MKKMVKKIKNGFTLIELLVVIAIIGVLASVVLASLRISRNKANDARIKSQLASLRSQIEIYYSSNYGSPVSGTESQGLSIGPGCSTNMFLTPEIQAILASSKYPSGSLGKCTVSSGGKGYAVAVRLSNSKWWIIDGKGKAILSNSQQVNYSDDATYTS